jgi:hypothetical protein
VIGGGMKVSYDLGVSSISETPTARGTGAMERRLCDWHAAGQGHYYADTNYILLGMIVERVSGRPVQGVLDTNTSCTSGDEGLHLFLLFISRPGRPPTFADSPGLSSSHYELRSIISVNTMFKPVRPATSDRHGLHSSTNEIFLGLTNIFEYFNEVDFLMDDVIGGCRSDKESQCRSAIAILPGLRAIRKLMSTDANKRLHVSTKR